ncbi:hypothetical protein BOTNAR_0024g00020 [Botryotinia narcissicola]|uniref:Uncharacterized protein n=1 Tax=Botryotinia narcissicola TaxID=278944 RepID=A0A4Z1J4B8_9HELO|nr:hypothetical protein BOTNAR_0024g00020 [Botryotinia narcissicola]
MPLHLVAWRLRLSLADIGLRILPIIFLGKGGRRDSEEWLRYLLVTGKARSRMGLRLKYDLEYLNSFSIFFSPIPRNSVEVRKVAIIRQCDVSINDTTLKMFLSIFRVQPYLVRVEDNNVAKGPDVQESWRGAQSCSGRSEEA